MEVDDRPNRPKKPMLTYWVIAIIVFLLLNTFVFPNLFRRQVEQTDYSTFLQMIEEKNIGEVSVEDTQITFSDKSGEHIYKTGTMNDPDLVNRLEEAGAVFSKPIVQQMGMLEYMLISYILPIALFALLGWFLSRKMMSKMGDGESMMTFGMGGGSKSNAKVYVEAQTGITFANVAGQDEAKEALMELVDFLHYITESNEKGLPEECDERLRRLHESIQEIKTSTSVEVEYMKMEERERLVKKEAIERGLREGRIQGRIQGERIGEERLASLLMNLSKQNRQEDSIKALENLEYRKKLYEEFGL